MLRISLLFLVLISCGFEPFTVSAADKPAEPRKIKHQITGLFSPDREQDLRDLFAKLPKFKLISIDYANAEAIVEYDPAKVFPDAKPEQLVERFDHELRSASRGTFGSKPLLAIPKEKLVSIEIPVEGLDCKGCAFAAYQMVYQLPGVQHATVSFKTGFVIAWVDPEKIDRSVLEKALKQGGVKLKTKK